MYMAKQLQSASIDMLPSFADLKASTKTSMHHISLLALAACFWIDMMMTVDLVIGQTPDLPPESHFLSNTVR